MAIDYVCMDVSKKFGFYRVTLITVTDCDVLNVPTKQGNHHNGDQAAR